MSITVVQPYFECKLQNCLLRNLDSDGVCAITLDLTDDQWLALLKKYDNSIYFTSADCSMGVDPSFKVIENCDRFWIYGPVDTVADSSSALSTAAGLPAAVLSGQGDESISLGL